MASTGTRQLTGSATAAGQRGKRPVAKDAKVVPELDVKKAKMLLLSSLRTGAAKIIAGTPSSQADTLSTTGAGSPAGDACSEAASGGLSAPASPLQPAAPPPKQGEGEAGQQAAPTPRAQGEAGPTAAKVWKEILTDADSDEDEEALKDKRDPTPHTLPLVGRDFLSPLPTRFPQEIQPQPEEDLASLHKRVESMVKTVYEKARRDLRDEKVCEAGTQSKEEQDFMEIIESGEFDLRGPLGQKFQRETKGDENYKGLKSNADRREYRIKWARVKYTTIRQRKSFNESFRKVDTTQGTYRPFAYILKKEGGKDDSAAVKAAINIAVKCANMGEPWVLYNTMSERWEFLYIIRSTSDVFERSWTLFEEHFDQNAADNIAAIEDPPAEQTETKPKPKPMEAPKKNTTPKEKTKLDIVASKAAKFKQSYNSQYSSSSKLLQMIRSGDEKWAPFNSDAMIGGFKALLGEMDELNDIQMAYLTSTDMKTLRANHAEATIIDALEGLVAKESKLDDLKKQHAKLQTMQKNYYS